MKRRRVLLKYWRGYLVAAILAAISGALMALAEKYTSLVDMVYPYVTRTVQGFLAVWSSGTDLLLWQVGAVVLVLALMTKVMLGLLHLMPKNLILIIQKVFTMVQVKKRFLTYKYLPMKSLNL